MPDTPPPILLITRPQPAAERFATQVAARFPGRFVPLIAPLIAIRTRPVPAPPAGCAGLIFTSENALNAFVAAHADRSLPAYCVGERTAKAARAAGFSARAAAGTGADLARLVGAELAPGARLFHPRGAHLAGDMAAPLRAAGITLVDAVVYDQPALPLSPAAVDALAGSLPIVAPLFSPRTARLFAAALPGDAPAPLTAVSLSQAVAEALPPGLPNVTAARPDAAAMLDALGRLA
jgi:uroporphyrinogen-III synthase